jgi:hypothetical protein
MVRFEILVNFEGAAVENPVSKPNRFEWQNIIQEAVVELDPEKLRAKIAEAESLIFARLQGIGQDGTGNEERNALRDASNTLLTLKREVLKFPDWKP